MNNLTKDKDKDKHQHHYSINDINIGVFSFNLGSTTKQVNSKSLFDDFKKIFNLEERKIWIITTQEDNNNSLFCNTLKKYFLSSDIKSNLGTITNTNIQNKTSSKTSSKTKKTTNTNVYNTNIINSDSDSNSDSNITDNRKTDNHFTNYYLLSHKKAGFHINLFFKNIAFKSHLMIFVPYEMYIQNMFKVLYSYKLKHFITTKSSIITTFKITVNKKTEPIIITTVGSHLPINTKDKIDLGSKERIESITDVLDLITNKIITPINSSSLSNSTQHILWAGDLNFRLTEQNNIHTDQLINYLKLLSTQNTIKIKLKDFTNIKNIGPTCKVKSIPKIKRQTTCIKEYLGKHKPTNYCYDISKKIDSTLFRSSIIKKRLPSYCDRIIGWSKGKYKIVSTNTNVVVNTNFDKYSDHNPIMGYFKFVTNKKNNT